MKIVVANDDSEVVLNYQDTDYMDLDELLSSIGDDIQLYIDQGKLAPNFTADET